MMIDKFKILGQTLVRILPFNVEEEMVNHVGCRMKWPVHEAMRRHYIKRVTH